MALFSMQYVAVTNEMEIFVFIFVSIGVLLIPGPNVLVIIATSVSSGRVRGFQTVVGTSCAMLIQLAIAAFVTSYFVEMLAIGFVWLKWFGVCYLLYLGAHNIRNSLFHRSNNRSVSSTGSFQRGFWVSLTNPKTILFFSAYLPQFATGTTSYISQIVILSGTFWLLAIMLDSTFSLLASRLHSYMANRNLSRVQEGCSGVFYLGAGSILAGVKNS